MIGGHLRYVQLRAFHHVATEGGFSRAAAHLNLTQLAISDQVRRLEQDYDVLLFDRSKKQVQLTPAGTELLTITRRLFEAEREAAHYLGESRAFRAGTLRVLADSAAHVTPILAGFCATYPDVQIRLKSGNSETVLKALDAYEADIGIMGEYPENDDAYDIQRIGVSSIVGCVSRRGPLSGLTEIFIEDLTKYPLIFREEGSKTRARIMDAAAQAGVTLKPTIEAEGREAVREIVASGNGIGFVSQAEFGQDRRLMPVLIRTDAELVMEEVLLCLKERSEGRLIQAFLKIAKGGGKVDRAGLPKFLVTPPS